MSKPLFPVNSLPFSVLSLPALYSVCSRLNCISWVGKTIVYVCDFITWEEVASMSFWKMLKPVARKQNLLVGNTTLQFQILWYKNCWKLSAFFLIMALLSLWDYGHNKRQYWSTKGCLDQVFFVLNPIVKPLTSGICHNDYSSSSGDHDCVDQISQQPTHLSSRYFNTSANSQ